jgi:quercetin dioxygenase-like cupin family protein
MIRFRRAQEMEAWKISPQDTNRMIMLFDPLVDGAGFTAIVEVFDVGGRTPPNRHDIGQEMFFVLRGEGRAYADGQTCDLRQGDSLLLMPGTQHEIENTGTGRLYCLTVMVPNDGFAELIRAGQRVPVDAEDYETIGGLARGGM